VQGNRDSVVSNIRCLCLTHFYLLQELLDSQAFMYVLEVEGKNCFLSGTQRKVVVDSSHHRDQHYNYNLIFPFESAIII